MRLFSTLLVCAPVGILASTAAAQSDWQGFCGNYVQTTSNAGQCVNCRLLIADNPEIQLYLVEADTGWSAELTWVEGDESVASGVGKWGNVGGPYDNATFSIDLSKQGPVLSMIMSHTHPGLGAPIEATYVCLDTF